MLSVLEAPRADDAEHKTHRKESKPAVKGGVATDVTVTTARLEQQAIQAKKREEISAANAHLRSLFEMRRYDKMPPGRQWHYELTAAAKSHGWWFNEQIRSTYVDFDNEIEDFFGGVILVSPIGQVWVGYGNRSRRRQWNAFEDALKNCTIVHTCPFGNGVTTGATEARARARGIPLTTVAQETGAQAIVSSGSESESSAAVGAGDALGVLSSKATTHQEQRESKTQMQVPLALIAPIVQVARVSSVVQDAGFSSLQQRLLGPPIRRIVRLSKQLPQAIVPDTAAVSAYSQDDNRETLVELMTPRSPRPKDKLRGPSGLKVRRSSKSTSTAIRSAVAPVVIGAAVGAFTGAETSDLTVIAAPTASLAKREPAASSGVDVLPGTVGIIVPA
jgi:hypothetical protein